MNSFNRDQNRYKVEVGMTLYNSIWNMMRLNGSLKDETINDYLESTFSTSFIPNPQIVVSPSRARLLGAAQCEIYHTLFCNTSMNARLKFTVDLSWMIADLNKVVYKNTFLPYEARLYIHVNGRKKEEVLSDTGYLKSTLEWNIDEAFVDRGIKYIAEQTQKAVERLHRMRVRNMLKGVGMESILTA